MTEVRIRVFGSRLEAELARSALGAFGIDSRIESDTAGGTYPQLESAGVGLLVSAGQAQAAEEVLSNAEEVSEADLEQIKREIAPEELMSPMSRRSPVLTLALVVAAALVGIFVGSSGIERSTSYDGVFESDQNADGATDRWTVYEGGDVRDDRADRNFDGRVDAWQFYREGVIGRAELDDDFDTEVDGWFEYEFNEISRAAFDLDGNGVPDYSIEYRFGVATLGTLHPNGGSTEREEVFVDGALREVYGLSPDEGRVLLRSFDQQGREQEPGRENSRRSTSH